jgi:hypothetical protein
LELSRHISAKQPLVKYSKNSKVVWLAVEYTPRRRQNDVSLRARVTSVHTLQLQAQFHVLSLLTEESHYAVCTIQSGEKKSVS